MTKKPFFCYLIATAAFILALIIGHGAFKLFHREAKTTRSFQLSVSVAQPHKASVKNYMEAVGQCTAYKHITLVPQVAGTLLEVYRANGGSVKQGEILFKLDERSFHAALQQSEAQLAIDQAKHALNVSQLKRSEGLRSGNFVSQQEFDSYKTNVAASEAALKLDQATCELKRIDLEHCTIAAPFDGELSKSTVDPNTFVTVGTSLAVLNQLKPIYVDTFLAEKHLVPLLTAKSDEIEVEARLIDNPEIVQKGKLVFSGNEVDKSTGTFDIRAEFANDTLQFWPGRGVDIKIYYKAVPNAMLVPESAIHEGNKGSYVYIVNGKGLAEMCPIKVGQTYSHWTVVEGLKGQEQVIAEGHALLAPGVPVKARQTVSAPETLK